MDTGAKAYSRSRARLTELGQIYPRNNPQLRVASQRLPVIEQYDRLSVRRDLDRPQGDSL